MKGIVEQLAGDQLQPKIFNLYNFAEFDEAAIWSG